MKLFRLFLCAALMCVLFCLVTESLSAQEKSVATAYIETANPDKTRAQLVQKVLEYVGTPYKYGGLSSAGIDCSGLIFVCVRDVTGKAVPRMVKNIYKVVQPVDVADLQPGDIVFFDTAGPLSHAGIFVGTPPDGSCHDAFVHSVSSGSRTGVKITRLSDGYWKKRFTSCGRIFLPVAKQVGVSAPADKARDVKRNKDSDVNHSWDEYRAADQERFDASKRDDQQKIDAWDKRAQKKY